MNKEEIEVECSNYEPISKSNIDCQHNLKGGSACKYNCSLKLMGNGYINNSKCNGRE